MRYQIFRYDLPYIFPIRIGSQLNSVRSGLYVKAIEKSGYVGWGEIAPLDGYGPDSLGDVLDLLEGPPESYTESMRFGFDCAYREILAQEMGCTFRDTFGPCVRETIPSAQLILTAEDVSGNKARVVHYKTKVGSAPVETEVKRVCAILEALASSAFSAESNGGRLRLDANGMWSSSDAFQFAAELSRTCGRYMEQIEFIEEPWKGCFKSRGEQGGQLDAGSDELERSRVPIPFPFLKAIDESFSLSSDRWRQADIVVLKPGLTGSIDEFHAIRLQAEQNSQRVVISSAFETFLGMSAIVALASSIHGNAEGLGTYRFLSHPILSDWLTQPDILVAGLPDIPGRLVEEASLTEVSSFEGIRPMWGEESS